MDYYFILLRIFHIGAGAFWVGNVLLLAIIINPALKVTGASGHKFVDYMVKNRRFGTESATAGGMAGIAGLLLYWHDSKGLTSLWMQSSPGISFGIGAVLGLIAFVFGILTDRKMKAMALLREKIEEEPADELALQLQEIGKKQSRYLMVCAASLSLSLWVMAAARYLVF